MGKPKEFLHAQTFQEEFYTNMNRRHVHMQLCIVNIYKSRVFGLLDKLSACIGLSASSSDITDWLKVLSCLGFGKETLASSPGVHG